MTRDHFSHDEQTGPGPSRRRVHGLSRKQKYALVILEHARQPGVVTTGATGLYDGQPWINWRTAYSLHDRRLARVHPYGEADSEVTLS